ncbi:hypothetical protein CSQ85_09200 [Bifidobacterium rousetti]|uniref:DUF6710 family protein n=1 Tax=Bifidobacterium rousetti TaxID=2045439 RepID=UPI0012388153|nr:DUF6710 family protein [Bifidobacterium rousetti]KAA8818327.1 hypothetical protein CSQ85_09200 [Bifidobacterium rousetti]
MGFSELIGKLCGDGRPDKANILTDEQADTLRKTAREVLDKTHASTPCTHPVYALVNAFARSIQAEYAIAAILYNMQTTEGTQSDSYGAVVNTFGEKDLLQWIIPDTSTQPGNGGTPKINGIDFGAMEFTTASDSSNNRQLKTVTEKYPTLMKYPIRPYADPVIACPWNDEQLLKALTNPAIGSNSQAPAASETLLLPFGVTIVVEGGNHATIANILNGVGKVTPTTVIDIPHPRASMPSIFDHVEYDEDGYHWDSGEPYAPAPDRRLAALYIIGQEIAKARHPVNFHGITVN